MTIAAFYVVAQSVAAGSLIEALVGIPFWVSVLITVAAMLTYVGWAGWWRPRGCRSSRPRC